MRYNKKNQAFTIIGRFRIVEADGEKEYCRIRFHATGHVGIVPSMLVQTLDFEDPSLIIERIEEAESIITPMPEQIDTKEDGTEYEVPEVIEETAPSKPVVIATNPEGKKIEVFDLESFVAENKLDMEAVKAVLAGSQKTHRKWRFKAV